MFRPRPEFLSVGAGLAPTLFTQETMKIKKDFAIGDKIRVQENAGWVDKPVGIISSVPEPVETLQGEDCFYWVRFDAPAQDIDGDGPYKSAQILSRYLVLEDDVRYEVVNPGLEARTTAWIFSKLPPEVDQ